MKKIIAREVPPESIDFSFYFDDDGLKNTSGENCACYIIPADRRRNYGLNMDEYGEIEEQAERLIEAFEDVLHKSDYNKGYEPCNTYKEAMQDNGIIYTSRKCHLLKEWAKNADTGDTGSIAEYLTITTGEEWEARAFCGYSQGDYCEVLYCAAHYSQEHIAEIGKFWLGCGTEFSIDDCYGYYIIDSVRWKEGEELINQLADYAGCKAEELEIQLYTGERRTAEYRTLTA